MKHLIKGVDTEKSAVQCIILYMRGLEEIL